jgi:hypothetical protein
VRKRVRATIFWGLPWAFPLYTVNSNRIKATFPNCRLFCFNVKSFDSNNFSKMPCCCKTNVEAAHIIGLFFMFLSLFACLPAFSIKDKEKMIAEIVTCISGAFVNGILVYGAYKRNRSALLIWIILQIIGLVALIIFGIPVLGLLITYMKSFQGNLLYQIQKSTSTKYYSKPLSYAHLSCVIFDDRHF